MDYIGKLNTLMSGHWWLNEPEAIEIFILVIFLY